MARTPPAWMQNLDAPLGAKYVTSVTGEVLIGAEVDELRKGDGLPTGKTGRVRGAHRPRLKGRAVRGGSGKPAENVSLPHEATAPSINGTLRAKQKVEGAHKKRRQFRRGKNIFDHLTPVVPLLCGQPSPSYKVAGTQIVAARKGRHKKRKGRNSRGHGGSGQTPVLAQTAVQHLGNSDPNDAARQWATNYREGGKFGSFPIHDAHGDESTP